MIVCRHCNSRYESDAPSFCGRCGTDLRRLSPAAAEAPGASSRGPGLDGSSDADADDGGAEVLVDPLVGRVVGGRYRILERIGSGGMGVVYKVEHTAMGKLAALKMLHPMLSSEREVVKRFRTEARAVSLLTHPNTVQVFDFGESEGALFMVMELVRGHSLAQLVERHGPLPWRRAAPLFIQVCEALAEAHEAGVIHRDIKPENILVPRTREGREVVKVLDFGLAKLREQKELASTTARGAVLGTPYFMAPEQIRGEALDARSDIYAVGATAYAVLTGEHPFDGESPLRVLTAHLTAALVPASVRRADLDIDPRVDALLSRCLAREPAERFSTADELRLAIEALRGVSGPRQERSADSTGPMWVRPSGPQTGSSHPRRVVEGSGAGVPPQLSREDFDKFELALRRRRWLGQAAAAVLFVAAVAGGGFLVLRGEAFRPVTVEAEPNNEPATANAVGQALAVRGHVGKRLGSDASDRDFYHLRVERGPVVARLAVTAIPNMDLHLSLYDRYGERIADAGAARPGAGEAIPNLRLEAGDYFAEVREERVAGALPTENVTDEYSFTAAWHVAGPDEESEPDETPSMALPLVPGRPFIGYAGRPGDLDFYYPRGEPGGLLEGQVSGVEGVDLRLVVLPPGTVSAADPSSVVGARVFDTAGPGAPESFGGVPWPPSGGAPLVVVVRKDRPAPGAAAASPTAPAGAEADPGAGTETPYTLLVTRRDTK